MERKEVKAWLVKTLLNTKDSGSVTGKPFELLIKLDQMGKIRTKNALGEQNKPDFTKGKIVYECKCNCGQIDDLKKNSTIIYGYNVNYSPLAKMVTDLTIIYNDDMNAFDEMLDTLIETAIENLHLLDEIYILPYDTFINVLNACGLIREKVGTDGKIRLAIQSYMNSKKKAEMFKALLEQYGERY